MKLRGLAAEMTVNQRFVNHEESPIEATYLFPLPEDASVCGFTVRTGERTIEGTVEERDKAFEIYDDAMAEGDGAFLLDQERPNVFHLSVGNVLPGQVVDVQIRLVSQVRYDSNFVRLMIPTDHLPPVHTRRPARGAAKGDRADHPSLCIRCALRFFP
jgi:Ca-activated chloride channel family protein